MGEGKADVVIGSDVVYDLTAATSVPRVIRSFLHPQHGVAVILLPAMRMVPLAHPHRVVVLTHPTFWSVGGARGWHDSKRRWRRRG
jgi:hypothetical protein